MQIDPELTMHRTVKFLSTLVLAGAAACSSAPAPAATPRMPSLAGEWLLNQTESQDPLDQVSENSNGRVGGGIWGGGGMSRSVQQVLAQMRTLVQALAEQRHKLVVQQVDSVIRFTWGDNSPIEVRTDGQVVTHELPGLGEFQMKAEWKHDLLIVERLLPEEIKIRDEFMRPVMARRLIVVTKVSGPMPRAITYRSVYDPAN
jgi:hypothetical protein